jgi:hypothetical protein
VQAQVILCVLVRPVFCASATRATPRSPHTPRRKAREDAVSQSSCHDRNVRTNLGKVTSRRCSWRLVRSGESLPGVVRDPGWRRHLREAGLFARTGAEAWSQLRKGSMDVCEETPRIRRSLHTLSRPPREMHEVKAHTNGCACMPQRHEGDPQDEAVPAPTTSVCGHEGTPTRIGMKVRSNSLYRGSLTSSSLQPPRLARCRRKI